MVPKHLADAEIGPELMHRHAMFGVAAKDLWRLVHQRRRRHGHLEAAVHVVHHAAKGVASGDGRCRGGVAERAEELSSGTVVGEATRSEDGGEVSIVAERR